MVVDHLDVSLRRWQRVRCFRRDGQDQINGWQQAIRVIRTSVQHPCGGSSSRKNTKMRGPACLPTTKL
ncbi:hypothetical protein HYQ46_007451 [Verticillium longisporum]|nr:hypothetical protein HYQ46_007451 [Verticillium longisporum]